MSLVYLKLVFVFSYFVSFFLGLELCTVASKKGSSDPTNVSEMTSLLQHSRFPEPFVSVTFIYLSGRPVLPKVCALPLPYGHCLGLLGNTSEEN